MRSKRVSFLLVVVVLLRRKLRVVTAFIKHIHTFFAIQTYILCTCYWYKWKSDSVNRHCCGKRLIKGNVINRRWLILLGERYSNILYRREGRCIVWFEGYKWRIWWIYRQIARQLFKRFLKLSVALLIRAILKVPGHLATEPGEFERFHFSPVFAAYVDLWSFLHTGVVFVCFQITVRFLHMDFESKLSSWWLCRLW